MSDLSIGQWALLVGGALAVASFICTGLFLAACAYYSRRD